MGFFSSLNPFSNPLPGITGGLLNPTGANPVAVKRSMGIGLVNKSDLTDIISPPTSFKDARENASRAVDIAKGINDRMVDAAGVPLRNSGIDYLEWADERAQKFNNALSTDAAENAKLAVNTTNLNNGILEKSNRAEVTRMNPALHAKLQAIGSAVGSTGIPIASQIGLAVAAIEAARRREAGLINNRQLGTSLAGTALGAYGPSMGGGVQGGLLRGGAGGAIGAYGSGRPILEGALTGAAAGGVGSYLNGVGQQYGVNPVLTRAGVGAATGAIRGGSEGAYAGGVGGLFSGVGAEYGGKPGSVIGSLFARELMRGNQTPRAPVQVPAQMPAQVAQGYQVMPMGQQMMSAPQGSPIALRANQSGLFGTNISQAGLNRSYLVG